MATDIKVPAVGESISEGILARWLKKDGERVQRDEPIFELETDKATQDVPSPAAGVLRVRVAQGSPVAIGSTVGVIEALAGTDGPPAKQAPPPHPSTLQSSRPPAPPTPATPREAAPREAAPPELPALPPVARSAAPPSQQRETRQPMSAIRQRIAQRLLASQRATASLTTFNEADMSAITDLRTRYKEHFKEKHGVGLGFMSFFVKATIEALKAFPLVNASIDENDIVYHPFYNIGVAVSTEKGLMVPVLRDADKMSFAQIEKTLADLAAKARTGKIDVADLQGGTFTITNGGIFGSMLSTPILNPPQSAILGMHAIQKRAVVVDDQIVIRPMMYLALTYDHRLIDGREAVLFLVRIKECLEDPAQMLLGL